MISTIRQNLTIENEIPLGNPVQSLLFACAIYLKRYEEFQVVPDFHTNINSLRRYCTFPG